MKKQLLSLMALFAGGVLLAQSNPTVTIPDFTTTSSTGITVNLYTELAKGKTIIIEGYFNACGKCRAAVPTIDAIYKAKGSGTGNVDIWTLNVNGESNASVNAFKATYGATNKYFGEASGDAAFGKVFFAFYPSGGGFGTPVFSVICPNKKGWWNVNAPPPTLTGFDSYIAKCATLPVSGVNEILRDKNKARLVGIYPTPSNNESKIEFFIAERGNVEITMFNFLGQQVGVLANENFDSGTHTIDLSAPNLPSGNYLIKMITEGGIQDVAKVVMVN